MSSKNQSDRVDALIVMEQEFNAELPEILEVLELLGPCFLVDIETDTYEKGLLLLQYNNTIDEFEFYFKTKKSRDKIELITAAYCVYKTEEQCKLFLDELNKRRK